MILRDLVARNRSYRRFHEEFPVVTATLRELVDLARLSASGANRQPLKYLLSCDPARNAMIFPLLSWAGYLPDWPGPEAGERPSAYIVMLGDTELSQSFGIDPGIAAQSILLGATEHGLGGCIIASVQKPPLQQVLAIPERYQILYVIALGKPKEVVQIDPVGPDGDIRYWRDGESVHHVPKRSLDDIVLG
jgi:nitroreductase